MRLSYHLTFSFKKNLKIVDFTFLFPVRHSSLKCNMQQLSKNIEVLTVELNFNLDKNVQLVL